MMLRQYLLLVEAFVRGLLRPTPPTPPKTLTGNNATRTITVELYQSERLTGKCGRAPEETVALGLKNTFEDASVSYAIKRSNASIGFETDERPTSDLLAEFRQTYGQDGRDVDARLCLIDAPGGGKGELGGVYAVMGTNNIDERFDPTLARTPLSPRARNVRGAIHEVGHTLGGRHSTPILADAPAMAYSEQMVAQIAHYLDTGEPDPKD